MSEAFVRIEVYAILVLVFCAGISIGSVAISLMLLRRARRLLEEAVQNRLGMDNNFIQRLKREFPILGGDPPERKAPHH